jgi:hypothetical protein
VKEERRVFLEPATDMGDDGVERERAVAAEDLDDDAEVQRQRQRDKSRNKC